MNSNQNNGTAGSCRLHRFEKNRYFHGKLMTARDMEAEQQYHAGRHRTLTRHATGEGLLCGLDVSVTEEDGTLEIKVGKGLAVDCCGNPIVVTKPRTEKLPLPGGDPVYVHLTFTECSKESVPIPGSENACEQECAYNRVLESFDITCTDEEPEFKTIPKTVEYPDSADFGDDPDEYNAALAMMAQSYYEGSLAECETCDDTKLFVGEFTRSENGWVKTAQDRRPFVYTNDMLYAALAGHVADFENPHEVTASQLGALTRFGGVSNPEDGFVNLDSEGGGVLIESDDDANTIDLDATAESVGALKSVDDVSNPGGNVDFVSEGGVLIESDDDENEVRFDATAESVGALASLAGVEHPGGDVALGSSDNSIDIDDDNDAKEVDFRVSDEILARFDAFEERLTDLRSEFDEEVDRLRNRLDPLEQYVMDKTLKYKRDVFTDVQQRFRINGAIEELLELTAEGIDDEWFRKREEYYEFLLAALELERDLVDDLESRVTSDSLERYVNALDRLEETLEDETRLIDAAVEQDFVCETAERLQADRDLG